MSDSSDGKQRVARLLVLVSCSLANLVVMGYGQGLAVVYVQVTDVFSSTRAVTSLLQSLCFGVTFLGACVGGPLAGRLGPGVTTLLGSLVATVGVVVASFSTDVIMLLVSGGLVTGLGLSMIYPSQFITVGHVCKRRKTIALSAMSVASGLGGFVFAFLNFYLLEYFDWRGTLLISSAIILNCFVCGTVTLTFMKKGLFSVTRSENESGYLVSVFQPKLFTDVKFVLFLVCGLLNFITFPTLTLFIVDHALHIGFDLKTGSFMLSIMAVGNVSGRVIGGFLNSVLNIPSLIIYAISSFLTGISMMTFVYVTSHPGVLICVVMNGLFFGVVIVTIPVATLEITGLRQYAAGIGYYFGVVGLGHVLCGPIGGGLKDVFGSYDIMYYCAAGSGTISAILLTSAIVYPWTRRDVTRRDRDVKRSHQVEKRDIVTRL